MKPNLQARNSPSGRMSNADAVMIMRVFVEYVADQDDEADGLRDEARAVLARLDGRPWPDET